MSLLTVIAVSAVYLGLAYFFYGGLLARLLRLDNRTPTPAVTLRDDLDYQPTEPRLLMGQHFSAIAAAGPIVGPVLAGVAFGWLPALLWILLGCVLIGGVHDLTSLVASLRHRARSIAEVVREHMSRRAYLLFLIFVWIALVYIIVAFTDVTASSFVDVQRLENGAQILGPGIATSSLLYLVLPIAMGLLMRYAGWSLGLATLVFVPLVGLSIWVGQLWPLDLQRAFGLTAAQATTAWGTLLLVYCVFAAIIPVWLLLQPRGYLGGVFLYVALAGGMLGLAFGGRSVEYPAWIGWTSARGETLFPMLFITIACGACSGFHALICSGTTSKQLARERDARAIGYGAMLLEGMVAVVSLCCVMMLAPAAPVLQGGVKPNLIYALGIGSFLNVLGIPHEWAVAFALMAFTTFVYDTLDVCTRLGRYILQELTGWRGAAGRWVATAATAGVPLYFLWQRPRGADGAPVQLWRTFWALFGASNQLLAALTLLGVTVWLWRTRRAAWVLFIVGLPTLFMYAMSTWALIAMTVPAFVRDGRWRLPHEPVPWVAAVLLGLAAWMFVEALVVLGRSRPSPGAPLTCSARHPSRRG